MAPDEDWDDDLDPQYREPDPEPDPETNLSDPSEDLGPSIPDVSIPSPGDTEVPRSYLVAFWVLVLVVNGALLALWVGLLFVVFENDLDLGGRLMAVGAILGVYAYYRYRTFPDHPDAADDSGSDTADGTEGEVATAATDTGGDSRGETPTATTNAADGSRSETPTAETGATDGANGRPVGEEHHSDDDTATGSGDPGPVPGPGAPARAPQAIVEDDEGNRYVLIKRSGESSLVRDPETGRREYRPGDRLETVGASPLETVAGGVPDSTRRVLSATHDDRSLGLLLEVVDRGPVAVRSLLSDYDLCESDLHGLLAEFRAAGLVEETTVTGERGYEATQRAVEGVAHLRDR